MPVQARKKWLFKESVFFKKDPKAKSSHLFRAGTEVPKELIDNKKLKPYMHYELEEVPKDK